MSQRDSVSAWSHNLDPRVAWHALTHDSGAEICVIDRALRVAHANTALARTRSATPDELVGRTLAALHPQAVADDRAQVIEEVFRTQRAARVIGMLAGRWSLTTYHCCADTHSPHVLAVTAPAPPDAPPPLRRAAADDLGELDRLTERELQVLRLIGLGATTSEIAKRLTRSAKTIEGHRVSLGMKLGVGNRITLAARAIAAGLVNLSEDELRVTARQARLPANQLAPDE